jgi:putative protease
MNKPIELLAPAGSKDAFLAAVAAGADAVYFGLEEFNARTRAENIKSSDLALLCAAAHAHNCKCYLTLNIIIFNDEFDAIKILVKKAISDGIDAVIVQDIGLIYFLAENFPMLPVHVSTQVTTHNTAQIEFLAQFANVTQVNLSRELPLADISVINKKLAEHNLKSEVFVHGAYCISFSGQCYMSSILYGEAGNRGACVQPCRRSYTKNTGDVDPINAKTQFTPFNLKDNCAFDVAAELIKTGTDSFKIEGRIKSAEYVWAVTTAWRKKIDELNGVKASDIAVSDCSKDNSKQLLSGSFNRGFADDYLQNLASSAMFASQKDGEGDTKDNSVFNAGSVISYTSDTKQLIMRVNDASNSEKSTTCSTDKLVKGSKLTIRNTAGTFVCSGEISKIIANPGVQTGNATYEFHLTSKPDAYHVLRIERGQLVTAQPLLIAPEILKQLCSNIAESGNRILTDKNGKNSAMITITVSGGIGEKLAAQFSIVDGSSITVLSESLLTQAKNIGLSKDTLESKLCAFGGTPYTLANLDCSNIHGELFLPLKELKAMRRQAVEQLDAQNVVIDKVVESSKNEIEPIDSTEKEQTITKVSEKSEQSYAVIYSAFEDIEAERSKMVKLGDKEYQISKRILEIPLEWSAETESYLLEHKDVIPLFSAILFEQDLQHADSLLKKIADSSTSRFVWCENTGLAYLAEKKGLQVIAGSNLNTTNKHTINAYTSLLRCPIVVLSPELPLDDVIKSQSNGKIWYMLLSNQFLMQSRQCLVKNIPDAKGKLCSKKDCDRDCILHCNRHVEFVDLQKNNLLGIKRPGFYSALYKKELLNRQSILNTPYGEKLNAAVDTWIIDERKL